MKSTNTMTSTKLLLLSVFTGMILSACGHSHEKVYAVDRVEDAAAKAAAKAPPAEIIKFEDEGQPKLGIDTVANATADTPADSTTDAPTNTDNTADTSNTVATDSTTDAPANTDTPTTNSANSASDASQANASTP